MAVHMAVVAVEQVDRMVAVAVELAVHMVTVIA